MSYELRCSGWSSGPVRVATTRRRRRRGLRPAAGAFGLLLGTRSIHTFGMNEPIGAVAVDTAGRVVAARVVAPRRIWTVRAAAAIIEVPVAAGLPAVGAALAPYRATGTKNERARGRRLETGDR